jgi:hypothetical protein
MAYIPSNSPIPPPRRLRTPLPGPLLVCRRREGEERLDLPKVLGAAERRALGTLYVAFWILLALAIGIEVYDRLSVRTPARQGRKEEVRRQNAEIQLERP